MKVAKWDCGCLAIVEDSFPEGSRDSVVIKRCEEPSITVELARAAEEPADISKHIETYLPFDCNHTKMWAAMVNLGEFGALAAIVAGHDPTRWEQ